MAKPVKSTDLHLMLPAHEREALADWAREECRSLNGQIVHLLRRALAGRHIGETVELPPPSETDQVRDATRRAATRG